MFWFDRASFKTLCASILFVLVVGLAAFSSTMSAQADSLSELLKGSAFKWNGTVINVDPLKSSYKNSRSKKVWVDKKGLNKNGKELVAALRNAYKDGLEPRTYTSALPKKIDTLKAKDLVKLDL